MKNGVRKGVQLYKCLECGYQFRAGTETSEEDLWNAYQQEKQTIKELSARFGYDLETAEAMYSTRRWLYVAFICHQVIEKTLKAYWNATREDDPLFIHHLSNLAIRCGLYEQMSEAQQEFIAKLMPMNIEARYPDYKQKLALALNQQTCKAIIKDTKALQEWIKNRL